MSEGVPVGTKQEAYARFAAMVERFFVNKVAEPEAVEDLMHDTFVRFFQRRAEANAGDRAIMCPGPFLIGIAKKVLFEYWRARSKRERIDEIGDVSIADLSQGLPSKVSRAEKLQLVRELLRELPLSQQLVLELHYWQGVPYMEIASLLEVPLGTVATWARAGRKKLEVKLAVAWQQHEADVEVTDDDLGSPVSSGDRDALSAYSWYEASSGVIDHAGLARAAMVGVKAAAPTVVPKWLVELQIPARLPDASASDLSEISKAAWHAWVAMGKPS